MDWFIVCSDKCKGGLGVRNLALLNKALLCKRSWNFAVERKALWKRGKLCEGKLFMQSMGKKRAYGGLVL